MHVCIAVLVDIVFVIFETESHKSVFSFIRSTALIFFSQTGWLIMCLGFLYKNASFMRLHRNTKVLRYAEPNMTAKVA